MLALLVLGLVAVAIAVFVPLRFARRLTIVALVVSLALIPYPVVDLDTQPAHHGITGGDPVPYVYTISLVAALSLFLRDRGTQRWVAFAGATGGYLTLLLVYVWETSPAQQAGVQHLITGMVAFAVGIAIGSYILTDPVSAHVWAWAVLACLVLQLLMMTGQLLGIPLGLYETTQYFVNEGRPIGSFIHPSVPGKIALLALPSMLVLTHIKYRRISRLAWLAIGASVLVTILTQSRSNVLAVLGAVALWFMLDSRLRPSRRWALVAAVGALSIPAGAVLLPRILSDPEGGERSALLQTALNVLPDHLAYGLGANSYSAVVGQWDALAASGLPVHNTLLHSIIEVGLLGTVMVSVPLIVTAFRAVKSFNLAWPHRDAARALIAVSPGLLVIYMVGWGLLLQGVLMMWMLVLGMSYGMMGTDDRSLPADLNPNDEMIADEGGLWAAK